MRWLRGEHPEAVPLASCGGLPSAMTRRELLYWLCMSSVGREVVFTPTRRTWRKQGGDKGSILSVFLLLRQAKVPLIGATSELLHTKEKLVYRSISCERRWNREDNWGEGGGGALFFGIKYGTLSSYAYCPAEEPKKTHVEGGAGPSEKVTIDSHR